MRRICDERFSVHYPTYLSAEGKDFVSRLLQHRPYLRLGYAGDGVASLKRHPWFAVSRAAGFMQ